jgi:hypothetical protein
MFKEKECRDCGAIYQPKAPAQIVCVKCKVNRDAAMKERRRVKAYEKFCEKQIALGREHVIGVGQGGSNPKGKAHPQYKNGRGDFQRKSKQMKSELGECQICGKDLTNAGQFEWCVHHINRDRSDNELSNLILLCKRCHQIEHRCWEAFEGATTIPKGSTPQANGGGSAEQLDSDEYLDSFCICCGLELEIIRTGMVGCPECG